MPCHSKRMPRGTGSVLKLGGQAQDSMACNYLQLIEYEKLIMYLSSGAPPRPDEHVHTRSYPAVPFVRGNFSPVPPEKLLGFRLLL